MFLDKNNLFLDNLSPATRFGQKRYVFTQKQQVFGQFQGVFSSATRFGEIRNIIFSKFRTNLQQYLQSSGQFATSFGQAATILAVISRQVYNKIQAVSKLSETCPAPISQQVCNKILRHLQQEKKQVCIIITWRF